MKTLIKEKVEGGGTLLTYKVEFLSEILFFRKFLHFLYVKMKMCEITAFESNFYFCYNNLFDDIPEFTFVNQN